MLDDLDIDEPLHVCKPHHAKMNISEPPFDLTNSQVVCYNDTYILVFQSNPICQYTKFSLNDLSWSQSTISTPFVSQNAGCHCISEDLIVIVGYSQFGFFSIIDPCAWNISTISCIHEIAPLTSVYIRDINKIYVFFPESNSVCNIMVFDPYTTTSQHIYPKNNVPSSNVVFDTIQIGKSIIFYTKEEYYSFDLLEKKFSEAYPNRDPETLRIRGAKFHQISYDFFILFQYYHEKGLEERFPLFSAQKIMNSFDVACCCLELKDDFYAPFTHTKDSFYFFTMRDGSYYLNEIIFRKPYQCYNIELIERKDNFITFRIPTISRSFLGISAYLHTYSRNSLKESNIEFNISKTPQVITVSYSPHSDVVAYIELKNGLGYSFTEEMEIPAITSLETPLLRGKEFSFERIQLYWSKVNQNSITGFIVQGLYDSVYYSLFEIKNPAAKGIEFEMSVPYSSFRIYCFNDSEISDYSNEYKFKRPPSQQRTVWSQEQKQILEKEFKKNPKPSSEEKQKIAKLVNSQIKSVSHWYQNQRQKLKMG